jgi:signal transduction histidine kinase
MGYVELLEEAQLGPLNDEQQKAVGVIHRGTDRLGRLIEDLIEFSTASRAGVVLKLQPVDVPATMKSVIERSQAKADKAGVRLSMQVGSDVRALQADPEKLSWVLFQLVDNGVKFTPNKGEVTLAATREGPLVRLSVADTGIGIPPERQVEIFEPLHQLDGSPTRRYGGTGLGLALVRLILTAHGSEVVVQSEPGKGTTLSFMLPAADQAA